jgi:hypothetical protein
VLHFKTLSIACLPLVLAVVSCGGDDKTPAPAGCTHFDYANWPAPAPVTFDTAVMPLLQANCAQANTCHTKGSPFPPSLGFLGANTITAMEIKAGIVGQKSTEVPSMNYVTAGDPQNSYLMRKVEEANPGCGLTCMSIASMPMGCSTQMPNGGMPLSATDQNAIRAWIKQGAM